MERKFYVSEDGNFFSTEQIMEEFKTAKENGETESETFVEYLSNVTDKNGSLEEIKFYFFLRSGCFWECTEDIKATAYYDDDLNCIVDSFGGEYHIIKYMEDHEKVMTYHII